VLEERPLEDSLSSFLSTAGAYCGATAGALFYLVILAVWFHISSVVNDLAHRILFFVRRLLERLSKIRSRRLTISTSFSTIDDLYFYSGCLSFSYSSRLSCLERDTIFHCSLWWFFWLSSRAESIYTLERYCIRSSTFFSLLSLRFFWLSSRCTLLFVSGSCSLPNAQLLNYSPLSVVDIGGLSAVS
jgi:hypothetical protein